MANVGQNIERMAGACEAYEASFSDVLSSGRRLQQILNMGDDLEPLIGSAIDASIDFRKALDSYQNLRASDSVERAERRFQQVVLASELMVVSGNGFATLVRTILQNRRKQ